jgi:hypothetical protein
MTMKRTVSWAAIILFALTVYLNVFMTITGIGKSGARDTAMDADHQPATKQMEAGAAESTTSDASKTYKLPSNK